MSNENQKEIVVKKPSGWFKKILLGLFLLFVVIQFFQIDKNNNDPSKTRSITQLAAMPDTVNKIMQKACYDCHSNSTTYPWYSNIQPVGWFLRNHIEGAKHTLNFDEFTTYDKAKMIDKLEEIDKNIKAGEMPLSSYTWIHKDAILNDTQKKMIMDWADSVAAHVKAMK